MARWISIIEPGGRIVGALDTDVIWIAEPPAHKRPAKARVLRPLPVAIDFDAKIGDEQPRLDHCDLVWWQLEIFTGGGRVSATRYEQWFLMTTSEGIPNEVWKTDGWMNLQNAFGKASPSARSAAEKP